MLKAMLLVTVLGAGAGYDQNRPVSRIGTVEMPSMEECLDARVIILYKCKNSLRPS